MTLSRLAFSARSLAQSPLHTPQPRTQRASTRRSRHAAAASPQELQGPGPASHHGGLGAAPAGAGTTRPPRPLFFEARICSICYLDTEFFGFCFTRSRQSTKAFLRPASDAWNKPHQWRAAYCTMLVQTLTFAHQNKIP